LQNDFLNLLEWDYINNSDGREHLGASIPVLVYRLMQYSIHDELAVRYAGTVADEIIRGAGKRAGIALAKNLLDTTLPMPEFIAQTQRVMKEFQIGIMRMERSDPQSGTFTMTMAEDLDCSGLPLLDDAICHYDEGFIAGLLEAYTGNEFHVEEIDCWTTGDRVCRFRAQVK